MSEQNIFTLRIVDKDDMENMSVRNVLNFMERFNNEIHAKSPDLVKIIKFALKYLKFHESINIITQDFRESFNEINSVFYQVKERNPESNIEFLDVEQFPLKQTKQDQNKFQKTTNFIKTEIVKTSKLNLTKHEIQYLIIEVSELKFITKIENPELESSISFYNELVDFLKTIVQYIQENQDINTPQKPEQTTPEINPFKDQQTAELFEYIVINWNYNKQQKWADIYNEINDSENYKKKIPYSGDYEKYIKKRFSYLGKFQYEELKRKKPDNRDRQTLIRLIREFSKK